MIIAYLVHLWREVDIGKLLQESLTAGSVDLFDRWKDQTGNLLDARPDENGPVFFGFEAPSKQRGTKDTNVAPDV